MLQNRENTGVTSILTYLLIVVELLCSILLIGVILLQRTKGQGVGLAFGSGMGESLFGSQVGSVLTRTTVILAIVFLVNTTLLAVLGSSRRQKSVMDSIRPAVPAAESPSPMVPSGIPGSAGVTPVPEPVGAGEPGVPPPGVGSDTRGAN